MAKDRRFRAVSTRCGFLFLPGRDPRELDQPVDEPEVGRFLERFRKTTR